MSIDHVSIVLRRIPPTVTGTNRMVLLVLAEAANSETNECWPSVRTIAKRAGLQQEKYAVKAISALVDMGLVEIDPNGCPDHRIRADRRPNLYRMVGEMAVLHGGARRVAGDDTGGRDALDGGARRDDTGGRDALALPHMEPEVEPSQPQTVAISFDEFWQAYPSKTGKGAARTAWAKAVRKASVDTIMAGLAQYRASRKVAEGIICNPATWLNQERWMDEHPAASRVSKSTTSLASWAERSRGTEQRPAIGGGR